MGRPGFYLSLLGGWSFEEWYEAVDLMLALRPGLTPDFLLARTMDEIGAMYEAMARNQKTVAQYSGSDARCPFLRRR